jgi:hypothetical protein
MHTYVPSIGLKRLTKQVKEMHDDMYMSQQDNISKTKQYSDSIYTVSFIKLIKRDITDKGQVMANNCNIPTRPSAR